MSHHVVLIRGMASLFKPGSVRARVAAWWRATAVAHTTRTLAAWCVRPRLPRLSREWLRRHERDAAKHDAT